MKVRYYERDGIWWLDLRGDPFGRKRLTTGETDRKAAESRAPGVIADFLAGIRAPKVPPQGTIQAQEPAPIVDKSPTLREAFKLAMRTREQWMQSKDKATLEYTFGNLRLPEDTRMATLTRDRVRELRAKWLTEPGKRKGTTLSASAVNSRLSMLSVLLDVCDLPGHGVKHMSVKGTRRTRRIAQREIAAVQSWLYANHNRKGAITMADLMVVALDTGAREGELVELTHADINLEEARVTFRDTKNHESRVVPLPLSSVRILEARKGVPGGPFSDLSASQLKTLWSEARQALGLGDDEEFVFHIIRHEAASRMADAGVNPFVIQAIMGHSNITTTQIYVKASEEAMRRAQAQVQNQPA